MRNKKEMTITFGFRSWDQLEKNKEYDIAVLPYGAMAVAGKGNGICDLKIGVNAGNFYFGENLDCNDWISV